MEKIRDRLGISTDGWTSNERYEDAREENEHVKAEALDGQDNATRNEISEIGLSMTTRNCNVSEAALINVPRC